MLVLPAQLTLTPVNTHKHTQTHTNTHKHTQTHTNTHKHTNTQTHTNTHKHTQTHTNTVVKCGASRSTAEQLSHVFTGVRVRSVCAFGKSSLHPDIQTFSGRSRLGFTAHTQGAFSQRRCVGNPHVQLQRVSLEDSRTQVRGQTVKQSPEMRSVSHAPKVVVGKVPV